MISIFVQVQVDAEYESAYRIRDQLPIGTDPTWALQKSETSQNQK
jgi:hypothetical protein